MPDWDAIAAELGMHADWRELGYDEPETMLEMYERTERGAMVCPFPRCSFARREENLEAFFRHVHNPRLHGRNSAS